MGLLSGLATTLKAVCASGEPSSGGIFRVGRDKQLLCRYTAGGVEVSEGGRGCRGRA